MIPRSREQLEKDMQDCFLMTRDGSTLACGMLKRYRLVWWNISRRVREGGREGGSERELKSE